MTPVSIVYRVPPRLSDIRVFFFPTGGRSSLLLDNEKCVGRVQKRESYRADSIILGLEEPTDKRDPSGLCSSFSSY